MFVYCSQDRFGSGWNNFWGVDQQELPLNMVLESPFDADCSQSHASARGIVEQGKYELLDLLIESD